MGANSAASPPTLTAPSVDIRYARLRADVEGRLRRVCGDMTPDAFAELVDKVCAVKMRWDSESTRSELA